MEKARRAMVLALAWAAGMLCLGCGGDDEVARPIVLADDGSAAAQVKRSGEKETVVKDGEQVGDRYDRVGPPALAPGGRGIAFPARTGTKWRMVKDGEAAGQEYSGVSRAAYSPDGRYIVTTGWDSTAIVWEAAFG